MTNAIELKGIWKRLDSFQLGPLDMLVPEGSVVGYIGENGAGKSTTIKLMLGLMRPDGGTIRLLGHDTQTMGPKEKQDLAFVFDELFLPGEMKLKQAETFHRYLYGDAWQTETFRALCKRFKLPDERAIKLYSRGMRMQLALALALSHQAKLLLLDEATSGLDPVIRDDVLDILLEYLQDERHTILISSHILSDIEKIADYIAFVHEGRLLFMEAKDTLTEKYGLTSLSKEQLAELDPSAVVGKRVHRFGADVLVKRDLVPVNMELEKATVEEIMVYMIKGSR
ncbi:MAG: ABC transporter ATP-binding protein [Eubacteriales bacterium]|nr:ABC transporter ATP-binding protein [Eubacteriales bacterium]